MKQRRASPEEALQRSAKQSKYRNKPVIVDGRRFASKREAKRYGELKQLEKAGLIHSLSLQPRFKIEVNGQPICTYVGDFSYHDETAAGVYTLEDSKGVKTEVYKIKKKLVAAVFGIEIMEV